MPLFDMGVVLSALPSGTYSLKRHGAGDYVEGVFVPGSVTTSTIQASVQPAGGKELQRLPEGERLQDYLAVWTTSELLTLEGSRAPDRLVIDGAEYEVVAVEDWLSEGNYYKAIVHRVAS